MAPAFSADNSDAILTLNGSDINQSEPQTVFLNEGANELIVEVISADFESSANYVLRITR